MGLSTIVGSMPETAPLDHIMYVVGNLSMTHASYANLGFTVMPKMTHAELGTSNQIIVLSSTYIEFMGDLAYARTDIAERLGTRLQYGDGIIMTCLGTQNILPDRSRLEKQGLDPDPVRSARRAVTLPSGLREETDSHFFYTENADHPFLSFFFCQHNRPDLIWIPEYQAHPNTAQDITGMVFVSDDLEADRPYLNACLNRLSDSELNAEGFEFHVWTELPPTYKSLMPSTDQPPGLACGIRVKVASLETCRDHLISHGVTFTDDGNQILIPASVAHGAFIVFHR